MTKFNQARRLEDQHVAQKQMLLSRPPEKSSHKPQSSRHSPKSGASVSAALKQQQAGFDVLASKVPRQPRTHAMYRKESATEALSDDAPGDASNGNNQTQHTGSELEHSAGQIDKPSRQITCSAAKQHSDRVRALPKPALRSQSNPAELMLQANLVLEQLEQVQAKAGDSSQDQSQHHATSSPKHSPAYVAHKTFTCSQRRHSKAAEHGTLSDSVCRAEQPQHDSTPIPQEPTSSSTGYAEVSMPSSPPAAVASKTAPEPQRLASTDKSSSGHVTSPFALPAQQANAQRCELADATTEMGIQQAAKLQAMMPKPAARSSSDAHVDRETSAAPAAACELQEGRTRQASQALQGNAQQGQQPRPDAYGANTPMDNEHATMAVAGGRSPQGTSCFSFSSILQWHNTRKTLVCCKHRCVPHCGGFIVSSLHS